MFEIFEKAKKVGQPLEEVDVSHGVVPKGQDLSVPFLLAGLESFLSALQSMGSYKDDQAVFLKEWKASDLRISASRASRKEQHNQSSSLHP